MSVITDAIVLMGGGENDRIRLSEVNARLAELDEIRKQQFTMAEGSNMDWAGGNKFFCADIWAGSFNHINPDWLIEAVGSANWMNPKSVILLIDHEFDDDNDWVIHRFG